ncbi:FAD-dependent oxidoreductase [Candidatus Aerophobetes bacterium]|nr:FAD-dependent oxidoreductase [Candidatus Aerophobetes bacterium]
MRLEKLFSPIKIGRCLIKNRIVMAPMVANFEAVDGSITEALINYFEARAKGEVGLIISPFTMVNEEQRICTLAIFSDRFIPSLNRLCERVKVYGAKFLLQIAHPGGKGMRDFTAKRPVAPSSIFSPIYPELPEELSREKIEILIEEFVQAGRRAKQAGFDGVEVHAAHSYLIGQFISPHTNKRDDEYGGDFERRMRFVSEIVRGIKRLYGEDFVVGFKFSAHEHLKEGIDDELAQKIARHMEKENVHYIHVAATSSTIPGFLECDFPSVPSIYSPEGALVKLAENVKKVVDIPVMATGGITDPEYAETILKEKKADLVALGRTLIADADWPAKAMREDTIRYCIKCNTCHKRLFNKNRLTCTVNPAVGEEQRFEMRKTSFPKKVVILGAGPAGMQAALVASQRGHRVTLYEEKDKVGGKMVYASIPAFKPEIGKLLTYYEKNLERSTVELKLGQKIKGLDELSTDEPDVVIVAVGAEPLVPDVAGKDRKGVLTVLELFERNNLEIGENILIVGAGLIGCETGWYLASRGKAVKVIDILDRDAILQDEHDTNRSMLIRCMQKEGVKILPGREIKEIREKGALVQKEDGGEEFMLADSVVFATGFKPQANLKDVFFSNLPHTEVYFIGDCVEARKLYEAIHEGYNVAWRI